MTRIRTEENPQFLVYIRAAGLPEPVFEHRFHPIRRWRFDVAWPDHQVALEIEGGAFIRGRHTRGAGFRADLEKYNEAAALGWTVLRVLPEQLFTLRTLDLLRRTLRDGHDERDEGGGDDE